MKQLTLNAITWLLTKLKEQESYAIVTIKLQAGKPVRLVAELSAENDEEIQSLVRNEKP